MTRRRALAALGFANCSESRAFGSLPLKTSTVVLHLGEASVQVVTSVDASAQKGPSEYTLLSLHEDEQTAVAAAHTLLQRRGGRLVELRSTGKRLLSFGLGGRLYRVDPNRIFTDPGIDKSLRYYSQITPAAHQAVVLFRQKLIEIAFAKKATVLSVHNNAPGGYSVDSYKPGGSLAQDAAQVHTAAGRDPDDFCIVVNPALFQRMQKAGLNVVLQSATPADDGSLSVWCQQAGKPYINVECRHGHRAEQLSILETVTSMLVGAR